MSSKPNEEPVADAAMEAKIREIFALLSDKPRVIRRLQKILPPSRVQILDTDFVVYPKNNWTEYVMWRDLALPEHTETEDIRARLQGRDVTIVDVGANAGAFSLPILAAAGAQSQAILFEPNPEMIERLRANIALNNMAHVTVLDCAVSDAEGQSTLRFPRNGNLGQARVNVSYDNGSEGVLVQVRPLATCLAEANVTQVDFLKVDVEGLEDRVIAPLLSDDAAPKPALIYFEVAHRDSWVHPLDDILADRGYRQVGDFGTNALFKRT